MLLNTDCPLVRTDQANSIELVKIMQKLHYCDQSSSQSDNLNSLHISSQEHSSGDSIPIILNTPDSGITQSHQSLDCEMASSTLQDDDPINNQLNGHSNNDLNSNQLVDTIGQLMKTDDKLDYDDKVHFDFLTASQLQKIIDYYKGRFKEQHSFDNDDSVSSSSNSLFNNTQLNTSLSKNTSSPSQQQTTNQQVFSCFGCNLSEIEKLTGGLVLPTFIEFMILYLMKNGVSSVGVFRKSGVRSRINSLRRYCDSFFTLNHNALSSNTISITSNESFLSTNPLMQEALSKQKNGQSKPSFTLADLDRLFTEFSVYDIADTIKTWLREIKPKPLISKEVICAFKDYSNGLSTKERFCFDFVSLMNDTERYVLLIILNMLSWFAVNSSLNQMNAHNLAICFAPSLCEIAKLMNGKSNITTKSNPPTTSQSAQSSPLRTTATVNIESLSIPSSVPSRLLSNSPNVTTDLKMSTSSSADSIYANENECLVDAQKCLQYLIENCSSLQMFNSNSIPFQLNVTNSTNSITGYDNNNRSIYFLNEGNLLPQTYESSVLINACPMDILERLLYERDLIDPTVIEWEIEDCESVDEQHDIFTMKKQCSLFLPVKTFTVRRTWSYFDPADSVNQPNNINSKKTSKENKLKNKTSSSKHEKFTQQGILLKEEGFLYQSVYKITTNGEGKSLVQQSLAYDLRGHSFYWYQVSMLSIIDYQLNMLKQTFQIDYLNQKNVKSNNI